MFFMHSIMWNHWNHPGTWFSCWTFTMPTCLPFCTGGWRWKIHKNKYLYQIFYRV